MQNIRKSIHYTIVSAWISLILLCLPHRSALAEDANLARMAFKQGNEALKEGDFKAALEAFQTSYQAEARRL